MTADVDLAGRNVLLPMVEATAQRQTGPAAFDGLEQAEHDDILCPGISGMIHLGGMIEEKAAAEDPLAGFVVEGVIKGQDQSPIDQRGRNQIPGNRPEAIPGQLGGGHEEVETAGVHIQAKEGLQGAQQIAAHGGGEGDHDSQQDKGEPLSPFAP